MEYNNEELGNETGTEVSAVTDDKKTGKKNEKKERFEGDLRMGLLHSHCDSYSVCDKAGVF